MVAISILEVQNVISIFRDEIKDFKSNAESALQMHLLTVTDTAEKDYLTYASTIVGNVVTAEPSDLSRFQAEFDKIISPRDMRSKKRRVFRDKLLSDFGYSRLRSIFYPKYFHRIGIKSCVYCNALLVLVVEKETQGQPAKKYFQAKFQVDHYLSKAEYPCLSISLFNLYPVCANCNVSKGVRKTPFSLYSKNTPGPSDYKFKLVPGSKAKYLLSRDVGDLQIIFEEPPAKRGYETHDTLFAIKGIYDTQKDVAADLILKTTIYTEAYKKALMNSLPQIFHDPSVLNRLILSNYVDEKDIHKNALAKFVQDIAYDIGLLKKDN